MVTLLLADIGVLADVLTAPDVWFGPVYLFVVCLAAWTLGWRGAHVVGLGCMVLTFSINGVSLYPNGTSDIGWNLAVRVATLSVVITLICALRRGYFREWWLARTDSLSGALNRQAFFELGTGLADDRNWRLLIYADLDGLKNINDQLGHATGDTLIKDYAREVKRAIRRDDLFARIGGDEFLIFMPVKDQGAARSVASRLHEVMNSSKGTGSIARRCSLGALIVPPGSMPLDDLVRRADALMYRAKVRGAGLEVEVEGSMATSIAHGRARAVSRSIMKATSSWQGDRRRVEASQAPHVTP